MREDSGGRRVSWGLTLLAAVFVNAALLFIGLLSFTLSGQQTPKQAVITGHGRQKADWDWSSSHLISQSISALIDEAATGSVAESQSLLNTEAQSAAHASTWPRAAAGTLIPRETLTTANSRSKHRALACRLLKGFQTSEGSCSRPAAHLTHSVCEWVSSMISCPEHELCHCLLQAW